MNPKAHPIRWKIMRVATTAPASWLASHTLPLIDRLLYRLSRGRYTLLPLMSDLTVVMLTTRGAKSGLERTLPVVAVPRGSELIVVASNHGKPNHPGWYYNLLTNPVAHVTKDRTTFEIEAREAVGHERRDCWQSCLKTFPGWQDYDDRTNRHLPVMILRPTIHIARSL